MIANIDLLNEIKDGGLTMDDELVRLKEMGGGDCEGLINLAAMLDWSVSEFDLPQISEDPATGGQSELKCFAVLLVLYKLYL